MSGDRFSTNISPSAATGATSSAGLSRTSITPSISSEISASTAILQRHRILTQERQDFTTVHGYDTPPEIEEAGFKNEFDDCMKRAADLYERIYADLPSEAQYVVPFAYKIRWYMKMNLREALHMCELRTMPQGHPDYRFICQEMWRKIQEVHPSLAECGKFIDWQKYRLGRLQSEMRTEFKRAGMQKAE